MDVSKILVGAPDQLTTGAIFDAPLGTKLPTAASEALDAKFTASGYCSDDGLSLTPDRSTDKLDDWSGNSIRQLLKSFDATLKWSEMEMSYRSLCHAFGAENVTLVAATQQHGEQIKVAINANLPEPRSWVFNMKDGKNRMRVVVPNGQVTSVDEIDFVSSDAIKLPITLSCNADSEGNKVYIYTDDGKVTTA